MPNTLKSCLVAAVAALLLSMTLSDRALATCLTLERVDRSTAYWINRCPVGVDFMWRDEGACRSTAHDNWPCAWFAYTDDKLRVSVEGEVSWQECKSPGGLGDVHTVEMEGGLACVSDVYSRDLKTRNSILKQKLTAAKRARSQFASRPAVERGEERLWVAFAETYADRVTEKSRAYGIAWGLPSRTAALKAAVSACISHGGLDGCDNKGQLKARQANCIALAEGRASYDKEQGGVLWVAGFGDTSASAELDAFADCTKYRGGCSTIEIVRCIR